MKTEAFICTSPNVTGGAGGYEDGGGDPDPEERDRDGAKAFDGNGINDFPFDPTPSTKE